MNKYGKREKRKEEAPAKQPKVKSALLQTYFISLICLILCVTMFFGTSFAWFTSEVNNAGNEIYVGTLGVGLFKQATVATDATGATSWEDLSDGGKKLFDSNIRWEPGYTALETIKIVNKGDLAFKYVLSFTDGVGADKAEVTLNETQLGKVAEHFEVWVCKSSYTKIEGETFAEMTKKEEWSRVGITLADVLKGKAVFSGSVTADDIQKEINGEKTTHTYTVALHMKDDADSAVMGHKIGLNVKLVAYQMSSEQDDLGNYDDIAGASTVGELKSALSTGGNVLLTSDIEIKEATDRVSMTGGVLDGNGESISYTVSKDANDPSLGVVTTTGGVVRNLTIVGGEAGRALYITDLTSDLVVSDCTLSGAYAFNLNSATATEHTINFTNTVFNSWTSYANVMEHAYFTDCTFGATLRPYGDTTLTNCTFTGETLDVSELAAGETITLINCKYNGQTIEKAVLTSGSEKVDVTGSDLVEVAEGKLVKASNG